jgi:hypothetical protein
MGPATAAAPPIDVGRRPRGIAVGDFNEDDKPDLAVVVFGGDDVAVLLGDGQGHFSAPRHVGVGGGPMAISVGSFASPTSVDLAVVNSLTDSVSILYGDGHGQFPKVVSHPVPSRPSFLIVGDTNQDGNQDLVVGSATARRWRSSWATVTRSPRRPRPRSPVRPSRRWPRTSTATDRWIWSTPTSSAAPSRSCRASTRASSGDRSA